MLFYGVNLCECWCGGEAGKGNRFIFGHSNRGVNNPYFGKVHSTEVRQIISRVHKGETKTPEHVEKIAAQNRGRKHTEQAKKNMGDSHRGLKRTEETKKKISVGNKGLKRTEESRQKSSAAQKKLWEDPEFAVKRSKEVGERAKKLWADPDYRNMHTRENNPSWKGGISPEGTKLRQSSEGIKWKKEVFKRDNYTCHKCGRRGKITIHAHHIINFAKLYREKMELFDINNGITFCKDCHKNFHSLFGKENNNAQQIFEFIYLQGTY